MKTEGKREWWRRKHTNQPTEKVLKIRRRAGVWSVGRREEGGPVCGLEGSGEG